MAAQTGTVNLLPQDRFEFSPWGRFLIWALSTGRMVVVLTELIIILAFLSRFWLDRRLSDLSQLRFEKTQVVESMEDIKMQWEKTRLSLEAVTTAIAAQYDAATRLKNIQALTPVGVEYDSIEISSQSATVWGFANSSYLFSSFYSRMKESDLNELVEVARLEQSADRFPGFDFELRLVPKQNL